MNQPAKQDIDSGTGEIVTPGEPVDHVDIVDGQSAGHTIEPSEEIHEPGHRVSTKPGELSRDDIYSKARTTRDIQDAVDAAEATPEQAAAIARAKLEARGADPEADTDPYDGDGNLKQGWIDPNQPADPAAQPSVSPDPAPVPAGEPITAAPEPALDYGDETVTITVYGMKQDVPRAEIEAAGGIANYQKNLAADERMKRASTYEASLRSFDQELQERSAAMQAPPATDTTADPELPPTGVQGESVDVQAAAEGLVAAMYTGDREAAITQAAEVLTSFKDDVARTVQTVVGQPGEPQVSAAEQQVAQDRAAQEARERTEANQVFVEEFSDLQSGVLRNATYTMVQQVAAEPIMYGRPLAEITREAGLRVRKDVFGTDILPPTPATPQSQPAPTVNMPATGGETTDLADRMALKSRTVVQPLLPAAQRFTEPANTSGQTESNSEYINRMRRESRGQPEQ